MYPKDFFKYSKIPECGDVRMLEASICDFRYIKHSHDDYAIGLTATGYQSFFCNGSYYKVPSGGIMLINPEECHDGYCEDEYGYRYFMIYIPRKLFLDTVNEIYETKIRDFSFKNTVIFDNSLRDKIINLTNYINKDEKNSFCIHEMMLDFSEALIRINSSIQPKANSFSKNALVDRSVKMMNQCVEKQVFLDEICSQLNISKYHFIRIFKNKMGITPYQYALDVKVKMASKDLENGSEVLEACEKYGFYDLSHFYKRFKGVFGVTPMEYKRCYREV